MTQNNTYFSVIVAAFVGLSQPVVAQELAKEVVQETFDQLTRQGMAVAPGAVSVSGKTVEWKDIVVGLPDGAGSFTVAFVRAEEIGGDKVSITYPETMTFVIDPGAWSKMMKPEEDLPVMTVSMTTSGAKYIISGTADARKHDYNADRMVVGINSSEPGLSGNVVLSDLAQSHVVTLKGEGAAVFGNMVGTFKAAKVDVDYVLEQGPGKSATKGSYTGVNATYDMDEVSQATLGEMLSGARNARVDATIESTTGTTDIDQPQMSMVMETSSGVSTMRYEVAQGTVSVSGVGKDAKYVVKMKDLPLPPFEATMETVDMALSVPLRQSQEALPAKIKMEMGGLVVSDTVWGMIDPMGKLPRDAARLNIDVSGQMKWLVNVMEASELKSMPVQLDAVTINDVTLEIGGATLNGAGAATLDNSTVPPKAVGSVDLDLKGGFGLVDKIIEAGLIGPEQGMFVKGMAGMFTVPGGNGADHVTSKIEMKENGSILANGQQIK